MNRKSSADKVELFSNSGESRGFYSSKNRLNNLTGKEWVFSGKSVINKAYPPNRQHKLRSRHGGQKPPDLCADIIRTFTKEGQWVLDPFAGVGGTLLGASIAMRNALGIELNHEWVDIYKQVCKHENLKEQQIICGNSKEYLDVLARDNFQADFILTDVPYWHMDKVEKSRGKFKRVGEDLKEKNRSKLKIFNDLTYSSKEEWLDELKGIFIKSIILLKGSGYLAVFIGDMYNNKRYHFLSADLARMLESIDLTMKANLVWYDVSKSLHIYGYLYEFIPSMIHQNILIFRKEI